MKIARASADEIARAVVAAAHLVGADPLRIYEPPPPNPRSNVMARVRYLAFGGLIAVYPQAKRPDLARLLGIPAPKSVCGNYQNMTRAQWWCEDWVDEVAGAILGQQIAPKVDAAPEPAPEEMGPALPLPCDVEGRFLGVGLRGTVYRRPDGSVAAAPPAPRGPVQLGDPPPGRSALDMRRNGVGRPPCEDDEPSARAPRGVTLPRLRFLERREK